MRQRIAVAALLLSSVMMFGFFGCVKGDKVAVVQGEAITLEDLQARIKGYPPQFAAALQQRENKLKVLDQMIDEKVLLVASKKEGFEKDKDFKAQIDAAKNQLLLTMLIREKVEKKISVSDEDVRKFYASNPGQFQEVEQRKARHILVKTESEAKEILKTLKGGADFATLAKQKSVDPSAANGGDLGWFSRGQLVPDFERAVFAMKKGQLSDIVKTQFGFHVVRLDDVNVRPKMEFEKVQAQIKDALVAERRRVLTNELLASLKKEYKIKKDVNRVQ